MQHTLTVDGIEGALTLTAAPLARNGIPTWTVTATHPEGGSLAYQVIGFQGAWIATCVDSGEAPIEIHRAIRALFARASAWESQRRVGEGYDIDLAVAAALS